MRLTKLKTKIVTLPKKKGIEIRREGIVNPVDVRAHVAAISRGMKVTLLAA